VSGPGCPTLFASAFLATGEATKIAISERALPHHFTERALLRLDAPNFRIARITYFHLKPSDAKSTTTRLHSSTTMETLKLSARRGCQCHCICIYKRAYKSHEIWRF